jgi:UDPglucose 6-dehydrogenase
MRVCVQGLWHLGPVTAACLAYVGHDVYGLDFDEDTIQGLRLNKPPISEPGLSELIQKGGGAGKLSFFTSPVKALNGVELLWVTYDTPVNENDEADVDFVVGQVTLALPHLAIGATVLISSQMPVGSIRRLENIAQKLCPAKSIGFAYSPENLRLGKALEVFLKPDRIVVGVRSSQDKERIDRLLRPITDRIEWMSVESAEMTKHAINAFLATSVVFANEVASICELVGADAKEVERGLKSESRIGHKAYLSPGSAFAGGTLARDVEFLKKISNEERLAIPLLGAIRLSNDQHKNWVRRKLITFFPILNGVSVAVWGLTYKPGTDTLRRSLAVELCNWLLDQGAVLKVHDPAVTDLPESWSDRVQRVAEPLEALTGVSALVVATEWPQYKKISFEQISGLWPELVILDANRFVSHLMEAANVRYVAVGTPTV